MHVGGILDANKLGPLGPPVKYMRHFRQRQIFVSFNLALVLWIRTSI